MAETIVLDPSEVAASRTQMDVTPWIAEEGIDWGDAEIAAYMADQARGSSPVDFRVPNRTVTVPLTLKTMGGTTMFTARTRIQAKAALFQREGGWIKRLTSNGSAVFADVVNATLKLGGGWGQAHRGYDTDASLVIETLPDFYGAEVSLSDHSTTSAAELVFTETGIQGDYPARSRIVVDEDDGDRQLGLIWGIRSRTYDAATTARLAYDGSALTPRDVATTSGVSIRHTTIATDWTPILSTDIAGTGAMTHVGTYRVWATVTCTTTVDPLLDVRLVWDVGDLTNPVLNTPARVPAGLSNIYTIDLGEVRLDRAPSGTHRWQGQIQAKAATAPGTFDVKRLFLVPVDEGYGVLRAPLRSTAAFGAFTARDSFVQTAGTLTGKALDLGGTWAAAGDADPFLVEATGHTAQRTAVADASFQPPGGHYAIAGTATLAASVVQTDFKSSVLNEGDYFGVVARYTDTGNWLVGGVVVNALGGFNLLVYKQSASGTVVGWTRNEVMVNAADTWYRIQLHVDTSGLFALAFGLQAVQLPHTLTGHHPDFIAGGALDDGKVGIYNARTNATASTRNYDGFVAYPPASDAVMHPSQSAELRWDGVYREDAGGVSYGPVPFPTGDNPRLPPAGLEARTCEVFLKGSRGDYDTLTDPNIDDISARIFYRPCWLFVP